MSLSFPRTPLQVLAGEIQAAVGRQAFNWAVREAEQQGLRANAALRRAINSFRFGSRGPVNYRNRKRDFSGGIKPLKLNFEKPEPVAMSDNINFKRSKVTIGRSRKRTADQVFKATIADMQEVIFRWQACSASLLGPGRIPLAFGMDSNLDTLTQCVPMHIMSLTTHPGFQSSGDLGCVNHGMSRFVYRTPLSGFSGHFGYQRMYNQQADGTLAGGGWQYESGTSNPDVDEVFHKYTDIRLNLYGASTFPLKYRVMILTGMTTEMQVFEKSPVSDTVDSAAAPSDFPIGDLSPLNEFILDHVRPLVTNPIIGSNSDSTWKGKLKVMSDVTYDLPCLSYGNAVEEGYSSVNATNVRNVNIFLRHDKFRNYAWHALGTDRVPNENLASTGWTATDTSTLAASSLLMDVDREQRVFLVISCTAPSLLDNAVFGVAGPTGGPDSDPGAAYISSGSYDIVVRNCFRDGSS